MIRTGRVTWRWADPLIALSEELVDAQRLVGDKAPVRGPNLTMEPLR